MLDGFCFHNSAKLHLEYLKNLFLTCSQDGFFLLVVGENVNMNFVGRKSKAEWVKEKKKAFLKPTY